MEKGIITLDGEYFIFNEDYEFASPSTAASFVQLAAV
ncbi:DUF4357 domain-containing protein [Endozoicomonas sp. SCSIO W0465]|nr:DUF4357 domain-containing protein [Endozoicomonas sp. SCSIO W0465]USE38714.1 DUF4357 domain-containing protein [Endozoicomonas sp. SCSIO W0465]